MAALAPLNADLRTAHRTVRDVLREAILSGQLRGGQRLVQSDLAATLQVSVTPVREALRDLAGEGLVQFDAFRGATVHSPTAEELTEVYGLRQLLVPLAVRSAIDHITDDEVEAARSLCDEMAHTDDPARWLDLNRQFHQMLDSAAQQPILQDILRRLADRSALYVGVSISASPERRRLADLEHRKVLDAYARRDREEAVACSLEHLEETMRLVSQQLESVRADP